jgi:hypothetical protein
MSRARRLTLTALPDLPEIGLQAGEVVRVDRSTVPEVLYTYRRTCGI